MRADKIITSPIGDIYLAAEQGALIALRTYHLPDHCQRGGEVDERILDQAERQLGEYFDGIRRTFNIPLRMTGTPFQQDVWQATANVPYGMTATYGDIARKIGKPRSTRAVGMAENKNPITIIVPCHRIVGARGSLMGYAGGIERKTYLLRLERVEEK